jgi:hypothetical protein
MLFVFENLLNLKEIPSGVHFHPTTPAKFHYTLALKIQRDEGLSQ